MRILAVAETGPSHELSEGPWVAILVDSYCSGKSAPLLGHERTAIIEMCHSHVVAGR